MCKRSLDPLPVILRYESNLRVRAGRVAEVRHPERGGYMAHVIQKRKTREKRRPATEVRQRRGTNQAPTHVHAS
jgi:hypothetical protein